MTNALGVASVYATANSTAGSYSVMASVGSLKTSFSLTNSPYSPCDVDHSNQTNVADVQAMINEALGSRSPANDLNGDGIVDVVDIEIVIQAILHGVCW